MTERSYVGKVVMYKEKKGNRVQEPHDKVQPAGLCADILYPPHMTIYFLIRTLGAAEFGKYANT